MAETFEQCFHSVPLTERCEKCPAGIREIFTMNQLTGYMTRHTLQDKSSEQPAQAANEPRAIVRHFAAAMERKLAANDGVKGGWRDTGVFALLDLMRHEISEFQVAMYQFVNAEDRDVAEAELALLRQDVLDEAADVANYLMFACDVIGALPPTDERGR